MSTVFLILFDWNCRECSRAFSENIVRSGRAAPVWFSPERAKYTNSGRSPEKVNEEILKP